MAKEPSQKNSRDQNAGIPQSSSRGNMDEYEAVRTIVAENPGLLMRVLDKIRAARSASANDKTSFGNKNNDEKPTSKK